MSYATRQDLELQFGIENIKKWADVDNLNDDDTIADRIEWALEQGDDEVNDRMRGGPYAIPFVNDSASNVVPRKIIYCAAMWAGVTLYDSRSIADSDPKTDEVAGARKRFQMTMDKIMGGKYRLDYAYASPPYPQSITEAELAARRLALGVPEPGADLACDYDSVPDDPWRL